MAYLDLIILLPCHSLEDFPTHSEGDDASNLLACWSVLWHPQLIASAEKAPQWMRAEDPPQEIEGRLIAVPNISKEKLPTGYTQRIKEAGAILLRNATDREVLLQSALEPLGGETVATDLARDFMALGYAYLQVQLLTRQMRYSSNLDETYFNSQVLLAAQACIAGDASLTTERLSACFSLLGEERDRYYSVEAFLLDYVMLAETTLGKSLCQELQSEQPKNYLLSGELLHKISEHEPQTWELLTSPAIQTHVGIVGGENKEQRLPWLALEDVRTSLQQGASVFAEKLGKSPTVYGRWRWGLSPALPAILRQAGYIGAMHFTLEEGKFPEGSQAKLSWEGNEGTSIDSLTRPPLDAQNPKTFLQFYSKLGEAMDADHVATIVLAHWPGQSHACLNDLRRITKYSVCLGKFVTAEQYFQDTAQPGQSEAFSADRYKSPYLKQAIIRKQHDPISSVARYWQQRALWESMQAMHTLRQWVTGKVGEALPDFSAEILTQTEKCDNTQLSLKLSEKRQQLAEQLAASLCNTTGKLSGYTVLNPHACVRRLPCEPQELSHLPAAAKPIYAIAETAEKKQAVVDVPGMGFVWVGAAASAAVPVKNVQTLTNGTNQLRNEFFEAVINTTTGALQSVHAYNTRRNRLSQQLAIRTPGAPGKVGDVYRDPDETAQYTVMAADSLRITSNTQACGEITVTGRLMDLNGVTQATYQQIFRTWRGSRVLQIEIEVDTQTEFKSDPWSSYLASRFAWGEEAVELYRTQHAQHVLCGAKNIEAPHYVEIAHAEQKTTIFTGGLAFHRRVGTAKLDSLLLVRGETTRKFQLGVGIDVPHPFHEAQAFLAPTPCVALSGAPPRSGTSGWLLHLSSRNVVTSYLVTLTENDKVIGFRVRLLEVAGRAADLTLSAMKPIQKAHVVDFQGKIKQECKIENGNIVLPVTANQWIDLEAYW
jgi:alpha-mannosidase